MVDLASSKSMLEAWSWRARRALEGHYETARRLSHRHYWIGTLLIVSSVVVTALSGRSLGGSAQPVFDYALLFGSILALTLACIQVFLRDAERADQYRRVASRYSSIKRDIELCMVRLGTEGSKAVVTDLDRLGATLNRLGEDALPIPAGVWKVVDRKQQGEKSSFGKRTKSPAGGNAGAEVST